jgi:hypothetical protein
MESVRIIAEQADHEIIPKANIAASLLHRGYLKYVVMGSPDHPAYSLALSLWAIEVSAERLMVLLR